MKLKSPEVATLSPATSSVAPPIWTVPKLVNVMPPVVVSASIIAVWVSIALAPVPIPLPELRITWPAMMSAPASLPSSVIALLATSVTTPVVCTLPIVIESGDTEAAGDDVAMDWMGMTVAESEMPGMPTAEELQQLAAASGTEADDVFTTLMIRHHAAGAAMADHAADHGENERVRRLARAMARVQRTEINEMNARRVVLGLPRVEAASLEDLAGAHAH